MNAAETVETDPQQELAAPEHAGQTEHDTQPHQGHGHDDDEHQHAPALHPELTRSLEVEIPAEEVSAAFRTVTKSYSKQARIPGFRIGKVPPTLIRSRFQEQIRQDVVERILPAHFRAAIEKSGLKPVSQPQVTELHLADNEPLKFKAVFEVLPAIDITGYQEIRVPRPDTALTEAEFEAELERVRDSRSTMEPVGEERPLREGDWAQITFKGQVQPVGERLEASGAPIDLPIDEPIEGSDVSVEVGGKNTLPAFSQALEGANVGQELKFEVAYPADFGEARLAGKTIAYDVEVKGIKRRIAPEFNDEFARELGEYETFEQFRSELREHLASDKRRRLEAEAKDQLLGALAERYQFPIPESLVHQQVDARLDRGLRALAQQGMREEDMRKLDFGRLRAAQRDAAINEVKGMLLLDRIAEEEKIEASAAEVERELEIVSVQTREPLETLRARLTEDGSIVRLREQVRREKTGNLLFERLGA
ncbi:MAG TPA: trigger factor [Acidobacteriaceae bacterium]